jgi:hypothetical protein
MALREHLAILIRTSKATEIGAFPGPGAGDEKRHVRCLRQWLLRLHGRKYDE